MRRLVVAVGNYGVAIAVVLLLSAFLKIFIFGLYDPKFETAGAAMRFAADVETARVAVFSFVFGLVAFYLRFDARNSWRLGTISGFAQGLLVSALDMVHAGLVGTAVLWFASFVISVWLGFRVVGGKWPDVSHVRRSG